jgi:hypothetical protein
VIIIRDEKKLSKLQTPVMFCKLQGKSLEMLIQIVMQKYCAFSQHFSDSLHYFLTLFLYSKDQLEAVVVAAISLLRAKTVTFSTKILTIIRHARVRR